MQKRKIVNKNFALMFALLLTLTITIPLADLPIAHAQSSGEMASYAYVDITPNPNGVGKPPSFQCGLMYPSHRMLLPTT